MKYPKPIMSLSELEKLGFRRDYLYQMAHRRNQKYATRTSDKKRAKIMFDTDRFERERMKMTVL